ncbi:MAG TPA: Rieske 2Fe-2S domain-containing protein [Pirellulales bacterium]
MAAPTLEKTLEQQSWLGPVDTAMTAVANVAVPKAHWLQKVRNFLHGTWLGHPLHAAISDVPVGAFTVSTILDIVEMTTGRKDLAPGADAALVIGLAGSASAAITGLNDWQHVDNPARRLGILHAAINGSGSSLFLASLVMRRRGHRPAAQALGMLGFGAVMAGAWFGGRMVFRDKVGVDHSRREDLPTHFVDVLDDADLKPDRPRRVEADGAAIVLVRREGRIFALANACSHAGGPLAEGELEGNSLRCPWHGSRFCLETGRVLDGPATIAQPPLETRVRNGRIEVRMPPQQA